MSKKYFDDNEFLTPSEAAHRWDMKRNTLISALTRGRFDKQLSRNLVRKFTLHGSTDWYVSMKAMREVYGDEDKIQIIELWARVGDPNPPKKAVHFDRRFIKMLGPEEELPEEVMEGLRECDSYDKAREYLATAMA